MKNPQLLFVLLIAVILFQGCSTKQKPAGIDLSQRWKFKPGDDLSWILPNFDDTKWDSILPDQPWEKQGYKKLNGFAWYRTKFVIPSSLKEKSYLKDSLLIQLGKIDDCDQVFLNGQLIGENGRSVAMDKKPGNEFTGVQGKWYIDRKYVLPVSHPSILWDKENVIAVRVYDQGGLGGMFAGPFRITMLDVKDYLRFNTKEFAGTFSGDSIVKKKFTLQNSSGKYDFTGMLKVVATLADNGNTVFERETEVTLKKNDTLRDSIMIRIPLSTAAVIRVSFREKNSGEMVSDTTGTPYILTPALPDLPKINGPKVFGVRPWSPFLYHIPATGKPPLKYTVSNLPAGLSVDTNSGIITGNFRKQQEIVLKLKVENQLGSAEKELKVVVGNTISLTPPLGWNSWNCWGLSVSDKKIRQSAESMVISGLASHGWTYINIDDGWEDKHDKDGKILPNWKFPNMKGLCDYVHSLGLKTGIYSSPGPKTCGGYEGSYTFEEKDAEAYASWGIDYLKYDWCSYGNICPNPTTQEHFMHPYQVMKRAIRKVNRDIHYSLCQYGMGEVWKWGALVDGNSWRTTGDIDDSWESLSGIGFSQNASSPYSAPGRWNDPDMLVVGYVGWGPSLHYTGLTPDEQYTHISLWCLLSAPLLIGCDLGQLDPFTLNLLTNDEVLAVDQDPLGRQALQVKANPEYEIWAKEMEDGSKVIGIFNKTTKPLNVQVTLADLGLTGCFDMRDLWKQRDLGPVELSFEKRVQPHGAGLLRLKKH
jgi:alpha-galactosidase